MATKPPKVKPEYDGKTPLMDAQQELFCILFTTNTLPNFWGNGQNSYAFAYGHDKRIEDIDEEILSIKELMTGKKSKRKGKSLASLAREIEEKGLQKRRILKVCRSAAPRLLSSVSVKVRCGYLLDQLTSFSIVDRELVYVIQQRDNLDVKMRGIEHHDKRQQRIREKVDIKHEFEPISGFTYVTPEGVAPAKKTK